MWKINQRIVKLMVELMRNYDTPESLVILASASDLLLRATDGMLVDGEACTLPQLEVSYLVHGFSHSDACLIKLFSFIIVYHDIMDTSQIDMTLMNSIQRVVRLLL